MKIVHAVYSMEMGGAEMLVAQLCRLQRAQGHEVVVCAYSNLGPLGEGLKRDGIDVRVLGEASVPKTMVRYWKLFRSLKPDVVHMHNPAPTLQAAAGARLAGAKAVISTRHSLVSPPYETAEELKFSAFEWLWLDWTAGICEITCNNLRNAPGARHSRIVRVYNGVTPLQRVEAAPRTEDEFRLLFVGRLAKIKDLPTMIRAVALAAERVPELRLDIVGDGAVRGELEALSIELGLTDRVHFHGQQMDTARFFSAADAFTMSSVSEGLPMSLLQAMSLGLPALCTDVGGMQEVLRLSGSGLLTPMGDSVAMADAMVRMARSPEMCVLFGQRAIEAFEREFTLEQMAAAYERLYRGVL